MLNPKSKIPVESVGVSKGTMEAVQEIIIKFFPQ